jgi:microcin C transport system permease protein
LKKVIDREERKRIFLTLWSLPPFFVRIFQKVNMTTFLLRFKKNRRAVISSWIFLFLFSVSLFSNFIANDRPLLVIYKSEIYLPIFFDYYETEFGGDFETLTEYRDIYISDKIEESGFILWTPIRYSYDSINYEIGSPAPSPPTVENLLGTDDKARDILARILYGLRISILFGFSLTILSISLAVVIGGIQGYYGGNIDLFGQRFTEIWSGLPILFLIIILSSFITPHFWSLLFIMLLFSWIPIASLVRAEFLKVRNFEYVGASKVLGASDFRIIFRHILPNAVVSTVTYLPFILVSSIVTLTSLDFLGFGLPVESASLGEILSQAKSNIYAYWIGISIFLVLSTLLVSLIFIGEGVRDGLDTRR